MHGTVSEVGQSIAHAGRLKLSANPVLAFGRQTLLRFIARCSATKTTNASFGLKNEHRLQEVSRSRSNSLSYELGTLALLGQILR